MNLNVSTATNKNTVGCLQAADSSTTEGDAWGAFTLIELLVVISIIGLLSSVVLVSLSGARESARDARRLQDMRQIQTALELYYNDNGKYPPHTNAGTGDFEISSRNNGLFLDPLVDNGYLANFSLDPVNEFDGNFTSGGVDQVYSYYHFAAGYRGCPKSGYVLLVTDMESIGSDSHPDSPEFSCGGATTFFTDISDWVSGSYD